MRSVVLFSLLSMFVSFQVHAQVACEKGILLEPGNYEVDYIKFSGTGEKTYSVLFSSPQINLLEGQGTLFNSVVVTPGDEIVLGEEAIKRFFTNQPSCMRFIVGTEIKANQSLNDVVAHVDDLTHSTESTLKDGQLGRSIVVDDLHSGGLYTIGEDYPVNDLYLNIIKLNAETEKDARDSIQVIGIRDLVITADHKRPTPSPNKFNAEGCSEGFRAVGNQCLARSVGVHGIGRK